LRETRLCWTRNVPSPTTYTVRRTYLPIWPRWYLLVRTLEHKMQCASYGAMGYCGMDRKRSVAEMFGKP
jgi:hypothetical protein